MRAQILALWNDVNHSYWFVPSLMVLAAIALAFGLPALDLSVGGGWIADADWLSANRPEGARNLLTTVAGSMIGVAGVTFSITIASVVYASGQYGPRLLTNFMHDRGNQVTLGTFIATFLYCLLVLRTIRSAAEDGVNFVPHIALLAGLVLALCSIGVLIYFIHHTPESIHVSNVIAEVGESLCDKVDKLFPERFGGHPPSDAPGVRVALPDAFFDEATRVTAARSGYVQAVDDASLMGGATAHDLVLRLRYRPGDFVVTGDTLALAWPPDRAGDVEDDIGRAFALGTQRTALQDTRFLFNELVEIAARALSPGVNDPFTAITCLDWLGAALKALAARDHPPACRYDADGALRVVAEASSFTDFLEHVFGQLRPYLAGDPNATQRAFLTMGEVGGRTDADGRAALRRHADALLAGALEVLPIDADKETLRRRHAQLLQVLTGRVSFEQATAETDWLGGTA